MPRNFPELTGEEEAEKFHTLADKLRAQYARPSNHVSSSGGDIGCLEFMMKATYTNQSIGSLVSGLEPTDGEVLHLYLLRVKVCPNGHVED